MPIESVSSAPYQAQPDDPPLVERPLFVVLNNGSGRQAGAPAGERICELLTRAGRRAELLLADRGQLDKVARQAVQRAVLERGIVVAAGGDGTLSTVAQALYGSGIPFGVVPLGTFNYFARNHGLPQDLEAATHCLLDAHIQPVHAGFLNGHIFLVNASLGLYPNLLEDRECDKAQLGRSRLVALFSAIKTLARVHRVLDVELEQDGQQRSLRTASMVVGSNALQLEHIGVPLAEAVQKGELAAMLVKPMGKPALYGLLLRGLLSRLGETENLRCFSFTELRVHRRRRRRRRIKVALDGEIRRLSLSLTFSAGRDCLPLLLPRNPDLLVRR